MPTPEPGVPFTAGTVDDMTQEVLDRQAADAAAEVTQDELDAIAATKGLPIGLTGATQATRYVGATASGAPASGTFAVGDFVIDRTGKVFICTGAGTPGTWVSASGTTGLGGKTPDQITGAPTIEAWFKADAITGKNDGDAISQWDDSSGNARHLVQATGGNQPIYKAAVAAFGGKPTVRFDGTDDFLQKTLTGMAAGTSYTIAAVVSHRANVTDDYFFDGRGTGFFEIGVDSGGYWFAQAGTPSAIPTSNDGRRGVAMMTAMTDGAVLTVWRDAMSIGEVAVTSSMTMGTITLGSNFGVDRFFNGGIAELVIFRGALTAAQRQELWAGLTEKYGLGVFR